MVSAVENERLLGPTEHDIYFVIIDIANLIRSVHETSLSSSTTRQIVSPLRFIMRKNEQETSSRCSRGCLYLSALAESSPINPSQHSCR